MSSSKRPDPYALKKPCANCPFLKDPEKAIRKHLRKGRVASIIDELTAGQSTSFACHKTIGGGYEDEDGVYHQSGRELQCAGSLIMMEKLGRSTNLMRIMERMGAYKPDEYKPAWPLVIEPQELKDL